MTLYEESYCRRMTSTCQRSLLANLVIIFCLDSALAARLSDSTTTAAYVNQRLIADRSAGSDRNPSTISDIDVTDTPTHQRNILTTEITTTTMMADQQQTASATVNWSQWQGPVHTHDLPRTLAGLDHITYDYVNHALSVDEHDQYLNTNARQQFEKNISATKANDYDYVYPIDDYEMTQNDDIYNDISFDHAGQLRDYHLGANSDHHSNIQLSKRLSELGIHDLRGRAISLRWLQHKQPYDVWSPAHYTWLTVILLTVIIIIITFAFKYRHVVTNAVTQCWRALLCSDRRRRWNTAAGTSAVDEVNTLLEHAQV